MRARISRSALAAVLDAAAASPRAEVCGLLLGSADRIVAATCCRNVAADPADRFEIDPSALIAAHRAARSGGPDIVGCFHSHPSGDAVPSARDAADAAPDGRLWLIAAAGSIAAFRAVPGGVVHARFDPVAIEVEDDP